MGFGSALPPPPPPPPPLPPGQLSGCAFPRPSSRRHSRLRRRRPLPPADRRLHSYTGSSSGSTWCASCGDPAAAGLSRQMRADALLPSAQTARSVATGGVAGTRNLTRPSSTSNAVGIRCAYVRSVIATELCPRSLQSLKMGTRRGDRARASARQARPSGGRVARARSATSASESCTVSISERSALSSRFVVPDSRKKLPVRCEARRGPTSG